MDANLDTKNPARPESDVPMTVDLMRELKEEGAITVSELELIFGLCNSSVYAYFGSAELSGTRLIQMFKMAKSDQARRIIQDALCGGTNWLAMKRPAAADVDGDGDVDLDDALVIAGDVIGQANSAMRREIKNRADEKPGNYTVARRAMQDAAEQALTAVAIFDFLEAQEDKRHRLNGKGLRRA